MICLLFTTYSLQPALHIRIFVSRKFNVSNKKRNVLYIAENKNASFNVFWFRLKNFKSVLCNYVTLSCMLSLLRARLHGAEKPLTSPYSIQWRNLGPLSPQSPRTPWSPRSPRSPRISGPPRAPRAPGAGRVRSKKSPTFLKKYQKKIVAKNNFGTKFSKVKLERRARGAKIREGLQGPSYDTDSITATASQLSSSVVPGNPSTSSGTGK